MRLLFPYKNLSLSPLFLFSSAVLRCCIVFFTPKSAICLSTDDGSERSSLLHFQHQHYAQHYFLPPQALKQHFFSSFLPLPLNFLHFTPSSDFPDSLYLKKSFESFSVIRLMEGGEVYGDDSRMANLLLKSESSEVLDSLWVPNSSPSFHGSASMVSFDDVRGDSTCGKPFFTQIDCKSENCSDEFDVCFHQPGKKRRLSQEQVQFLEKSFEVENKLEPERKISLAKELGLQPRQVAIWFQNRRARYKTKVLEREYGSLKSSYDKLKSDYDSLFKENEKMKNEVNLLTEKLVMKGKLDPKKPMLSLDAAAAAAAAAPPAMECKQEDAKSDVFDSDSPHYTHSATLEPADSSHVSDFSQDEDDTLSRSLMLPPSFFPKLEIECYDDLQPNSCNLGFPVQDQGTWFWQY